MQVGKKINLGSLEDLPKVAMEIIQELELQNTENKNNCLAFYGQMGAGKTTLIKAICKGLGVIDVTSSPTFAIINEYVANDERPIFHFDFYRLNDESEAFDFGYEEYFYSNELCLIEWPEKIEQLLPMPHYKIKITENDDGSRDIGLFKA